MTDLHVLQHTALVRTMVNIQRRDTLQNTGLITMMIQVHCDSFGLLRTKVAKSVQSLVPNWPRTEVDVQFGLGTKVTIDRTDRGPNWMYSSVSGPKWP